MLISIGISDNADLIIDPEIVQNIASGFPSSGVPKHVTIILLFYNDVFHNTFMLSGPFLRFGIADRTIKLRHFCPSFHFD